MKLYTSTTSPTARAIILTALAQGKDALQLAYADPWTTPPALTAVNPFSQVPVLITADGTAIPPASEMRRFEKSSCRNPSCPISRL